MKAFFFLFLLAFTGCVFENSESELCFIGDSITNQWDVEYYFPGYLIKKHAVDGAKIQDTKRWNLKDCSGTTTVFLMGTNNIGFLDPKHAYQDTLTSFAKHYLSIVSSFETDDLLIVSILPRNYMEHQDSSINLLIEKQNQYIRDSLDARSIKYRYVDAFSIFLENGYEANLRLFRDGLHPSQEGYEVLSKRIKNYL